MLALDLIGQNIQCVVMTSNNDNVSKNRRQGSQQLSGNTFMVIDTLDMGWNPNDTVGFRYGCNAAGTSRQRGGDNPIAHLTQFYPQKLFNTEL